MWCMNMRLFTCSCTFIWVEWGNGVKEMSQPFIWHQLMSNICASLPPTLIMNGWAVHASPLHRCHHSEVPESICSLEACEVCPKCKTCIMLWITRMAAGVGCLLCNHADSVFYSHLSRLHLEDFGIDLFSSEMMQSLHNLIFYLICVKKKRYLHWESIEVSAISLQLSSWCV